MGFDSQLLIPFPGWKRGRRTTGFFLLLMILGGNCTLKGQEVIPTYSDYLTDNLYLLHPSMAGAANQNQIRLTARQQWFDVENPPNLQTLTINGRSGERIGLGGILFNDSNGNFSKSGVYASFAYHLMFSRSALDLNQLSFGINAGLIQHRLDRSRFFTYDPLLGEETADIYGNMDLGISYYYFNFYAHLAARNLLGVQRELFYSGGLPGNQRQYLFSSGYVFETVGAWSYEPSMLFQVREQTAEKQLDLNMKFYREMNFGQVWGGISYRNSFETREFSREAQEIASGQLRYITPFIGLNYKKFIFGYTFSYQLNSLVLSNNGFHQLSLGYDFGKSRARYDCKCPAVN